MSLVRRAAERRGADPRAPWGDSTPLPNSLVGGNVGGIQITENSAKAVAAVYGCCGLLADEVSALPTQLRNGAEIKSSKALPPSPLLQQPYAEISRRDWWVQFIWGLALRGNFFGQTIERDALDLPVQIKPIHNDNAEVRRRADGTLQYRYYNQVIPIEDVVHVRYQSSPGNIMGMSPIQACAIAFGVPLAQDRHAESFFLNSADPRGVIEIPGQLDRVEVKKMMRGWQAAHQGINQAHLPAVLTESATFKPITMSPLDSQLLEALQFSEQRICGRIFRIPPHMVGIVDKSTSWGRGIEQQKRGFIEDTLPGYLTIGQELMTSLHRSGTFMHFDTTRIMRGATLERAQSANLLMNSGTAMADEMRDWFDLGPLPGGAGQYTYLPINTQLLEAAVFALQQAKNPPEPVAALPPAEPGDGTPKQPDQPPAKNGNGNGRHMSPEAAEQIVRLALEQEQRRRAGEALVNATLRRPDDE